MTTATPQEIRKLAKFLDYVLGRRPDEFGLLPDEQGYVKIKTLLQSLHEDSDWRHVRQGHLQALMLLQQPVVIEMESDLIRARHRDRLPTPQPPSEMPKILYSAVRRRAYPVVVEKGIRPGGTPYILLSPDEETARRLGRRMDNDPVVIKIHVAQCRSAGTIFLRYGERLHLADVIPAQGLSGPALPKEKASPAPSKKPPRAMENTKTPGSFYPDPALIENPGVPRRRKREAEWKQDRRRARKEKERQWK
jgi:putative RNA 2'-phosphotransferase